ncbi:MAG: MFS transporter [Candidatus Helarchaeota archaeon]|nr:MFS transporter [Candidatus Helarchaeota archaeon]
MASRQTASSYRWIIIAVLWIGSFFISGSWLFIISIIGTIKFGNFNIGGLGTGEGALIVILPFVSLIPLAFVSGPIVDKVGVKKIGAIGYLVFTIFSVLRGVSDSFFTLAIFTICMGAGLGLTMPLAFKLIGYWFDESEIGTASGINMTASGFGIFFFEAITLPLILPLVGHWRNTFLFYGILTSIALVLWIIIIKEYPEGQSEKESEERAPIKEALSTIIRNKKIWYIIVINCALVLSYFAGKNAYRLLFPLRTGENSLLHSLIRIHYWFLDFGEPHHAVFIIAFISLGAMFSNLIIPNLSDRVKKRKIFLISGLIIMGITVVTTGILEGVLIWISAFIMGFAVGIIAPLAPTCIIEIVDAKYIGTSVGLTNSVSNSIVLVVTLIFPLLIPDKYNPISYLPLLLALGIICIIGVFFAQKLPETAGKMKRVH